MRGSPDVEIGLREADTAHGATAPHGRVARAAGTGTRASTSTPSPAWKLIAALPAERVPEALATTPSGLSGDEASRRRALHGPNEIPRARRPSVARRLGAQLTHLMALLLWAAGALAFASRMPELGTTIFAVVIVNGLFGAWQEHRADRALDALGALMPSYGSVVRDGRTVRLLARDIVPGDVLELRAGHRVPADVRVVVASGLALDVSVLTGESLPVERGAEACDPDVAADATSLAPAGATVVRGHGRGIVFATGPATELGRIARLASATPRARSTLEVQVARLVHVVTAIAIVMACAVFAVLVVVGAPLHETVVFAIGILVANVPEGLLPAITITLAGNVQRMARRRALVTRLSAVETLGAVDVVCTDKTGTITLNALTVRALWAPGVGECEPAAAPPAARRLLVAGCLANDARLDGAVAEGDPLDAALVKAALATGMDVPALRGACARIAERPFDAESRSMSVVLRPPPPGWPGEAAAILKGAPSTVLARCSALVEGDVTVALTPASSDLLLAESEALAARGLRVIGVARRCAAASEGSPPDAECDLAFLGLIALEDPPRPGVRETISRCRRAGVAVTIVTGDQRAAARAIAEAVGLWRPGWRVIEGPALEAMTDDRLDALLASPAGVVLARVPPSAKLRIVRSYQRLGHVVAVTGDGVNDAPALHAAHVGVAMGAGGTDVARAAADVILLDDDFATIVAAVEEGRATFSNVRKFLAYVLTSNVPEIVPFLAMVALEIPPALGILQILAVDLGTDMLPALALGAEPPEPGTMQRPPRRASARLLDASLLVRSYGFLGCIEAAACLGAFLWTWHAAGYAFADVQALTPSILAHAAPEAATATYRVATTAAFAAIVSCQVGNVLACRSEDTPFGGARAGRFLATAIVLEVALLFALVYAPPLQRFFDTAPLPSGAWPVLVLGAPAMLLADASWKWALACIRRARSSGRRGTAARRGARRTAR